MFLPVSSYGIPLDSLVFRDYHSCFIPELLLHCPCITSTSPLPHLANTFTPLSHSPALFFIIIINSKNFRFLQYENSVFWLNKKVFLGFMPSRFVRFHCATNCNSSCGCLSVCVPVAPVCSGHMISCGALLPRSVRLMVRLVVCLVILLIVLLIVRLMACLMVRLVVGCTDAHN